MLSFLDVENVLNVALLHVLINFLKHIENNNDVQVKEFFNFILK
jgi:hypothetical protein